MSRRHEPQLDGIRGIAIILVLLSHGVVLLHSLPEGGRSVLIRKLLVPGWGGVDVFFTLSGFLITGILLRARKGRGYFKSFYARRVLRIFPVYYFYLIFTLLLCGRAGPLNSVVRGTEAHLPETLSLKLAYFVYLQNVPVFWPTLASGLTGLWGAYWSLAVEEQFYLIWPALVRYCSKFWLLIACIALACAGPTIRREVALRVGDTLGLLQFPITRLDGLFAGSALALYRDCKGKPVPFVWGVACCSGGAAIMGAIAIWAPAELLGMGHYLNRFGPSAFTLLATGMIICTQHEQEFLRRVLTFQPLLTFGKYSYGVYIYHISIFFLFQRIGLASLDLRRPFSTVYGLAFIAAAAATSLFIAKISYLLFEQRFLALKSRFPSPVAS